MAITTIQETWDRYRKLKDQDMYDYSPFFRSIASGNILEVGVRDGVSTAAFLLGLDDKDTGHLWSIDLNPDCGGLYDHSRWTFVMGNSHDVEFDIPQLDILFVDGDHRYEAALGDLTRFEPYVKPGGIITMHDVHPDPEWLSIVEGWYPVEECRRAWNDFVGRHSDWETYIKPGITGLGVIIKNV